MWVHINLIGIGLLTIVVPGMFYGSPNASVIMSCILFLAGVYLTALYFIILYYKDSMDKLKKDNDILKAELESFKSK